jgi:hypothetical protein
MFRSADDLSATDKTCMDAVPIPLIFLLIYSALPEQEFLKAGKAISPSS